MIPVIAVYSINEYLCVGIYQHILILIRFFENELFKPATQNMAIFIYQIKITNTADDTKMNM